MHLNKKKPVLPILKTIHSFGPHYPIVFINVILLKNYLCTQVVCAVSNGTPFNLLIETKLFTGTHKPNPDL